MAIHVTPMWNPGREKDFNSSGRILKILQDGGTKLLSEAVEKGLRFREMKGKTGLGYVKKPECPARKSGDEWAKGLVYAHRQSASNKGGGI